MAYQYRMAKCSICKQRKRISSFAPSEIHKGGKSGRCRQCNRERRKQYQQQNIERLRQWEARHPEEVKERRRLWKLAYPDRVEAIRKRREKRLKANGGSHTHAEWLALCERFGGMCLACGVTAEPLTKDHVISILRGGRDDIKNLQPLCRDCNSRKGAKSIDYRKDFIRENEA